MLQKGGQGKMIARALRWVLGALCVLLLPSLAAQSPLPVSPPTARTSAAQKTPMWEVRVKGELGAVVYLLGSVHVCRATCYPLPQNLLQRFDSARVLAVELDPRRVGVAQGHHHPVPLAAPALHQRAVDAQIGASAATGASDTAASASTTRHSRARRNHTTHSTMNTLKNSR